MPSARGSYVRQDSGVFGGDSLRGLPKKGEREDEKQSRRFNSRRPINVKGGKKGEKATRPRMRSQSGKGRSREKLKSQGPEKATDPSLSGQEKTNSAMGVLNV